MSNGEQDIWLQMRHLQLEMIGLQLEVRCVQLEMRHLSLRVRDLQLSWETYDQRWETSNWRWPPLIGGGNLKLEFLPPGGIFSYCLGWSQWLITSRIKVQFAAVPIMVPYPSVCYIGVSSHAMPCPVSVFFQYQGSLNLSSGDGGSQAMPCQDKYQYLFTIRAFQICLWERVSQAVYIFKIWLKFVITNLFVQGLMVAPIR